MLKLWTNVETGGIAHDTALVWTEVLVRENKKVIKVVLVLLSFGKNTFFFSLNVHELTRDTPKSEASFLHEINYVSLF